MNNFILFNDTKEISNKLSSYLEKMKKSGLEKLGYDTFNNYIDICDWMIRRQEYNFAIDRFEEYAEGKDTKLMALDIGCGVVPLCNYFSNQGHEVTALDPIESDIDFIIQNDMNSIYDSNVKYLHGYGEILPFEDDSFDVVYSVSVLEHIPTGNDKIVLSEAMRVLKKGGLLILTTDVVPNNKQLHRDYTSAFVSASINNIFNFIGNYTNIDINIKDNLIEQLDKLTWDEVYDFWIKTKHLDNREDEKREYLAIGFHCIKEQSNQMNEKEKIKLFIEGESSLINGFYYYQEIATQRERSMIEKEDVIQNLISQVDSLHIENNKYRKNIFIKILNKLGLIK